MVFRFKLCGLELKWLTRLDTKAGFGRVPASFDSAAYAAIKPE